MKRRVTRRKTFWMIAAVVFALTTLLASARDTQAQWQGSGNIYYNSGNVGIGTTNPPRLLSVSNGGAEGFEVGPGNANGDASGKITMVSYNRSTSAYLANEWYASSFLFGTGGGSFNVYDHSTGTYRLTINSSGSVGIGTTNPPRRLSVSNGGAEGFEVGPGNANGDASGKITMVSYNRSTSSWIPNESHASSFMFSASSFNWYDHSAGVYRMTIDTSGNVGVGTAYPSQKLEVAGGIKASGFFWPTSGQAILSPDGNTVLMNTGNTYVNFANSNVGIGVSDPSYKLDVNGNTNVTGNITASGSINAKYQDVAEWVPSSEQLAAGTVVVLDSTKSNQVISSSVSYDTRVAGVISSQPGIALGEQGDNKVLVATSGRVKVKVDASKGPIHIGDLLVTSDVPGVAMKSEPIEFAGRKMHMPGTLIGKALEPLEKGSADVLVLLSLQ